MPATPIMMNNGAGGGSSPAFPYPVYKNPVPTPTPQTSPAPTRFGITPAANDYATPNQSLNSVGVNHNAAPSTTPAGRYIGMGSQADVGAGDKVYQTQANGGYYNNVYGSNGDLVAKYFHATHPQTVTTNPVVQPTTTTQNAQTIPNNNVSFKQLPSNQSTTNTNTGKSTGSTGTGLPSGGTTSAGTAGSTGTQSGNGLDPLDASLFNNWSNTMGNLGNTNNPVFQNEVQGLAQQLNDKYYQQWLTQRDKMGGQGLGQSGFLNNDQLREQMAEQNDLSGQYGTLLQNYLKDQLSQATNYSDMMKNMMPYYNLTAQNQVADQQNAQKLLDAQLNAAGYADINGSTTPTLAGQEAVGNQTGSFTNPYTGQTGSTLNAQKLYDQYNLLTPDQYATLSGYLPSSYGGGATLANTNDALSREISIGGLTGLWNGQPTLAAQNDAATRGNAASSTQLSNDKGLVDALNTRIDSLQTNNQPIDPALMKQYTDALNKYYTDIQSFGTSGN